MPRQRRGPRPARTGGAATRMHLPPHGPHGLQKSRRKLQRSKRARRAQARPCRAGRKIPNTANFPVCGIRTRGAQIRRGERSDAAHRREAGGKQQMTTQTEFLPCRAKSAAPVRPGRRRGNPHAPAAAAPAQDALYRRTTPPQTAAHRNAFSRMLAHSFRARRKNRTPPFSACFGGFRGEPYRRKARAASRKNAANRIVPAAPAGRGPALCESGKKNPEHCEFPCLKQDAFETWITASSYPHPAGNSAPARGRSESRVFPAAPARAGRGKCRSWKPPCRF